MSDWSEYNKRLEALQQAGNTAALKLDDLRIEAEQHRETNPEYRFDIYTRARDLATRLNEPWWILFFESMRLSTLTADLHDFARAHPLAMELMVRFARPENRGHSHEISIYFDVLYTYGQVDPLGHREELEQGFAYLDQRISKQPVSERFILNYRQTEYLREAQEWQEAYDRALQFQALVDRGGPSAWWQSWVLFLLCEISNALGLVDELAGYAEELAEHSKDGFQLIRTRATGLIWSAVAQRIRGKEKAASKSFHQGMRHLKGLEVRDEICANAIAMYYEVAQDWKASLGVRDRELAAISKKGMLHRQCILQIERCRLLARENALTADHLNHARNAAAKMRQSDWYLQKLVGLAPS